MNILNQIIFVALIGLQSIMVFALFFFIIREMGDTKKIKKKKWGKNGWLYNWFTDLTINWDR